MTKHDGIALYNTYTGNRLMQFPTSTFAQRMLALLAIKAYVQESPTASMSLVFDNEKYAGTGNSIASQCGALIKREAEAQPVEITQAGEVTKKTCKTCKHWVRFDAHRLYADPPSKISECHVCSNAKVTYSRELIPGQVVPTQDPNSLDGGIVIATPHEPPKRGPALNLRCDYVTGPKFGCIHHEATSAEETQAELGPAKEGRLARGENHSVGDAIVLDWRMYGAIESCLPCDHPRTR
jgi:hypothetical protein